VRVHQKVGSSNLFGRTQVRGHFRASRGPALAVEPVLRNATIDRIYEGTNRIQRVVIVARAAALILARFGLDSVLGTRRSAALVRLRLRRRRPGMGSRQLAAAGQPRQSPSTPDAC
jgi:hypothetical protein